MTAFDTLKDALQARQCAPKKNGSGWMAKCPSHDDGKASLSFNTGNDGNAVCNCLAGCSTQDVLAALGLSMTDLSGKPKWEEVCSYSYTDENGKPLFEVVRYKNKEFRQRHRDAAGNIVWNMQGVRRVLYRLREVIATAKAGGTVYVCEGEKDCDAGNALETAAEVIFTTNPGGAGKWRPEYSEHFRGAQVVIVADRDEPGRKHAAQVAKALQGIAASVRTVEAAYGKDLHNHLSSGHSLDQLVPVNLSRIEIKDAPTTAPKPQEAPRTLPAQYDLTQWRTAKPPEYHVDGIVPKSGLATISGPAGVGKSFLTLDLACRLAIGCGENWLGAFKTTHRPQCVLLVDYENGGARLAWRLRCLQNGGAFTATEIDEAIRNIVVFDRMPPGHDLVFSGLFGAWIKATQATVAIVDPLRAIVARGDDNNDPLARAAMMFELRAQLLESGVAAVLVDHDSKSGLPNSGTMATQDHADACWHLTQPRENDHDYLQLASLKPRDGRAGKIAFRRVREGAGIRFEPADVFEPDAELKRQIVARLKNGPMRQADLIAGLGSRTTVLEALDQLRSGGSAGTVVTTGARVNRSPVLALRRSTNEVSEVPE